MAQDLKTIWHAVLSEMKKDISSGQYAALFKNTSLVSVEDGIATIGAPSSMICNMLQIRYELPVKQHLEVLVNQDITPVFVVKQMIKHEDAPSSAEAPLFTSQITPGKIAIGHLPRVRTEYTFQNFAVSSSNELAFVSAKTVADNLGVSYNPFFIYGPVGVGKTHLMQAIANHVYHNTPEKKIIYTTSEEFTNEVVEAIRQHTTNRMKDRFRSAYLLIIDDVQFFEGKEQVQEELFHTFNFLVDNGSQIVLSSDRPPQEIKRLQNRLSSRFSMGLTVDIAPPDFELKTAILLIKAKKFGYELPMEVAQQIAERVEDTRTLEGVLNRIITQATTSKQEITEALVAKILRISPEESQGSRLHSEDILKQVCLFYSVKPTQLRGPKRNASLVRARQVLMYLLKTELAMTYVEIGNLLGGRDHTTVMHGVDKIEKLVHKKERIVEDIMGITKALRG